MKFKWMALLVGAVMMIGNTGSAEETMKKGSLVAVGGALRASNAAVYEKFIELAGGKKKALIGILPAASGKPVANSQKFKENLIQYGVPASQIHIIPIAVKDEKKTPTDESQWIKNADWTKVRDDIKSYSGIWMIGGDQTRITQALYRENGEETHALQSIRKVYENGGVIGGTSAGAAVLSDIMIASGDSYGALTEGFTSEYGSMDEQEYGPVMTQKGLGFFTFGTIDQHFDRKARYGRLVVVSYANHPAHPVGFGIDEDTALVVYPDGTAEALGAGGITVIDTREAEVLPDYEVTAFKNVKLSFFQQGDKYDLKTLTYINASKKYGTNGHEYFSVEDPIATGVFSRNAVMKHFIGYDLVDNKKATEIVSYLFGKDGTGFQLVFRQDEKTEGYWLALDGQMDSYAFVNVVLDILPVKVTVEPLK